jgi:hypothetical protein
MTSLKHLTWSRAIVAVLALIAVSACGSSSDSHGTLGHGGSGTGGSAGGTVGGGGASSVGGNAAGGVPGAGGVVATGGATSDAGLSGSGGHAGTDASADSCFSETTGCGPRGIGGAGGTGGNAEAGGGSLDSGRADAPECVITDVHCAWGYILDDKGCPVCAPAPAGTGGSGGADARSADVPISSDAGSLAALCTSTGGHVNGSMCCAGVGDFPSSCLAGACGCSPTSSDSIRTCTCPAGSCFSRATGCSPYTGPSPDAAPARDGDACAPTPEGDTFFCGGTRPAHYYTCTLTMLSDPCVVVNVGDMTNSFCCP